MAPLLTTLFGTLMRPARSPDRCLVCHHTVAADEPRVRLTGGGYVHRGCSTYSMRARAPRPATD